MDSTEIYNILKNKISCSEEQVSKYLKSFNIEDMKTTEQKRYRYEIWDKKEPINGVDAKTIISSRSYEINQAYLIYIDGQLVYFQDHNPYESGFAKMTKTDVKKIAEKFIQDKVESNVNSYVINSIYQKIKNEGVEVNG